MTNQLESLRQHSVIVADTGDIDAIARFRPQDATTNPSLILKAAQDPRYRRILQAAVAAAGIRSTADWNGTVLEHLVVGFGREILTLVPGRVSTEVDARLSFDAAATEAKARRFIELYDAAGVGRERILDQGREHVGRHPRGRATRARRHPLQSHAAVQLCAGRGVRGRGRHADLALRRPHLRLVQEVARRRRHRRRRGSRRASVPASTSTTRSSAIARRSWARASARRRRSPDLAGCDLLTISPDLLQQLEATPGTVAARLTVAGCARQQRRTHAARRTDLPLAAQRGRDGHREAGRRHPRLRCGRPQARRHWSPPCPPEAHAMTGHRAGPTMSCRVTYTRTRARGSVD